MPGVSSGSLAANSRQARALSRTRRLVGPLFGLIAIGASAIAGCGAASSPRTGPKPAMIRTSLATSVETSAGSWAVVPMGRLDQPLNTFWQLFFKPAGARLFSDRASSLAVATNGGLAIASNGKSLAIGIRPTNLLDYSPLIVTSNARSWSPGGPIGPLADQPDALSLSPTGNSLALVRSGRGSEVVVSPGVLGSWRDLVSTSQLAASRAGRLCGISSLTAVGYLGRDPLVGAGCSRSGVVGIFRSYQGSWRLAGPELGSSFAALGVDVLGLQQTTAGVCALVRLEGRGTAELEEACTAGGRQWRVSPSMPVTGRDNVVSFGPADASGVFALISRSGAGERLEVLDTADMKWTGLPSPPAGTSTVVFGPAGALDALVAGVTACSDWRLAHGATRWKRIQVIQVAIQFGSSG